MNIEGYSELVEIYTGAHSKVFRAKRDKDNLCVALKCPTGEFPDPRQLSALKREYQIMSAIEGDGRGVPTQIEFIELKNSAVLVREWVEGISLREYLDTHHLSLQSSLTIGIAIAQLLSAVHRQSYCHRDISPGNIIFNPETQQVSLLDFGSSLEFPDRARGVIKPNFIEGSIPYMSPEQTGRMNRGLDYRTDFYSFGVLLYELFTGQLPFETKDTNELIYSHIALEPTAPDEISPMVPKALARIVLKLLSKKPDNRYQSAEGVEADLSQCLAAWTKFGAIEPFELASAELNSSLRIPETIYGREQETERLLDAFAQTSQGNGHLVFVAGHSGIGKTSLVRELYRPLTAQGGYITSGKYDQLLRHQPYSAILQAVSGLFRQIISESHDSVTFWQQALQQAVGGNGQVLIDVIPELELLIGPQPQVMPLSAEAASTRFNTTFFNLIHALGTTGKPIVLFIDDLQWIDPASLTLLEAVTAQLSQSTLMIIGAYRDNEVLEHHPLMIAMPTLQGNCTNTVVVELSELPKDTLIDLLKDSVVLSPSEYEQLNATLCDKTGGNPLIYKTMLTTLYTQQLLSFDYESKRWVWDQKALNLMPRAENSVAMLQSNMSGLDTQTLELLKLAGCIGNTFSLDLLTALSNHGRSELAKSLIPAVSKGYIQPLDDDFELYTTDGYDKLPDTQFIFVHDRIQQAAYSLLSSEEQEKLHWAIGQKLLSKQTDEPSERVLFDAVEHQNQGYRYATSEEKSLLVKLNLMAGKRAKRSAAFSVAHSCLSHAKTILQQLGDATNSDLSVTIDLELAQACYLVSEFDAAEALYSDLRSRDISDQEKLNLYNIQAKQYHHQGAYQRSLEYEYEALQLLGIELPEDDESLMALFGEEQNKIEKLLEQTDHQRLLHQANIEDECFSLTHELLFDAFTDGYLLGKGPLLAVVAATSARLSMERGNCAASSAGYINYATILCSSGNYRQGHEIGQLAIKLADKYQNPVFKNYTYHVFSLGINHWLEPLKSSYDYWHEASKLSMESGSPYAGWVFLQMPHVLLASGASLEQVQAQADSSLDYLTGNRLGDIAQLLQLIVLQPLRHLKGETPSFSSIDGELFCTEQLLTDYQEAPFFFGHTAYSVLRASLLARDILPATTLKAWLPIIENTVQAQIIQVDSCFYTGLHLTAGCTELSGKERDKQLAWVESLVDKFKVWSELCPGNFAHKSLLLQAEVKRLEGDVLGAFDLYELSREAALESRFLMDAALADELAGLFWSQAGKPYQAQHYLQRSLEGYEQWGASGKVAALVEQYPELEASHVSSGVNISSTIDSTVNTDDFSSILDMSSVVKASQAVSQHMQMDKLAEELLNLAVENAGATRGLLLLENGGDFFVTQKVTAENDTNDTEGLDKPYAESACLSRTIVRYVINSGQPVVYTPTEHDEQFERCNYLRQQGDISVLCVPIIRQGTMSGVLYLENTHLAEAFQADRVQTLKIIASQAAISLENARMYRDLEEMNNNLEELVKERTKKLYEANQQLTDTNQTLYTLSTTDQLTGLYNRRFVEEQLHNLLESDPQSRHPVSLLMLDVDHFKSVNDNYGHNTGDRVLVNVSASIKASIRSVDMAGRWGGEEFIVLCMSDIDGATTSAKKLGQQIAKQDNSPVEQVTVSIGVTPVLNKDTIDSVLNRVDQALYSAKNSGRNQVMIKLK
ncbi:diguanylate cyclase [Vibrio sp. SCSIO 43136]|nr:diguanylate cyclase [Vibrio sp. SCSIO 43136]